MVIGLLVCGGSVFGTCFVVHYLVPFLVFNHLDKEERGDCFTLIVFLMPCDC